MNYPKSFQSKKYPEFIRNSIVLKAYPKPTKVFPKIGLSNCVISLNSLKLSSDANRSVFLWNLSRSLLELTAKPRKRKAPDFTLLNDINTLISEIEENPEGLISSDGKYILPNYGKFNHLKISKDRDLIFTLKSLKDICDERKIKFDLNLKMQQHFASEILNIKDAVLCFSSDNNKGFWDIATMSMRGIKSCMNWKNSNSYSLVGSVVDPYAAVIYLSTNKNTPYGKNMIARSVVRFVADNKNKPSIFIEELYPNHHKDGHNIMAIFKSFLHSKVGNKIPIVYNPSDDYRNNKNYYIPKTAPTEDIMNISHDDYDGSPYLSYRDSDIQYKKMKPFYNPNNVKI